MLHPLDQSLDCQGVVIIFENGGYSNGRIQAQLTE